MDTLEVVRKTIQDIKLQSFEFTFTFTTETKTTQGAVNSVTMSIEDGKYLKISQVFGHAQITGFGMATLLATQTDLYFTFAPPAYTHLRLGSESNLRSCSEARWVNNPVGLLGLMSLAWEATNPRAGEFEGFLDLKTKDKAPSLVAVRLIEYLTFFLSEGKRVSPDFGKIPFALTVDSNGQFESLSIDVNAQSDTEIITFKYLLELSKILPAGAGGDVNPPTEVNEVPGPSGRCYPQPQT